MHPIQSLVRDYEWVHTSIGVVGNVLFFVGSILFLWSSTEPAGTWMFIVGSAAMLVGAAGSALVRREERRLRQAAH